eukprot:TRINITY_DN10217_c0_g1_i6.p1 TRINITY_DN10217_c0_g1~~TRINITY_DN10217_c0_g1_i6.p1  ORF type:complete len:103 (+),score=16.69 TRINITY_DN10217_c0_g1_i6:14-322(+)
MELGCDLMENLIQLFDEELLQNQNLQCPIVFHAITRFRSLSLREMVEFLRERLTRISKETRRELEEREGKEKKCNSCTKGGGCQLQSNNGMDVQGAPLVSYL